jgi:hypothetical protein
MSDTNWTGATQEGPILEISFDRVYFWIFLKKAKKCLEKDVGGRGGDGLIKSK